MIEKEDDSIVAEVREIRSRLNREANYDIRTLASKAAEFAQKAGFKMCNMSPLRPHYA